MAPEIARAWGVAASWRPSHGAGGTPGVHEDDQLPEGRQRIGDANQDASVNIVDAVVLSHFLFAGGAPVLPCGAGTLDDRGNVLLLDSNGDGDVNLSDPVYLLSYLFQRGAPPVLGSACVRMTGCPDVCGG